MPKVLSRSLAAVAALVAAGAAWWWLAPPQLGGGTSYAVIYGTSMQPHFHGGDLIVLRRRPSYGVGDVVGYHSHELHRAVLHRVIAVHGDSYRFKGDNNPFVDPEHPRASQLFGQEWVRIPGIGGQLQRLRSPRNAAILGGLATLFLLAGGGGAAHRRRRRRSDEPAPAVEAAPRALPPLATAVLGVGGIALAASLVVGFVAFSRPLARTLVWSDLYLQHGRFAYTADAPVGAVYQHPRLTSDDPVFLKLIRRLDVSFSYTVTSKAPAELAGRARLDAVLSDGNGWRRRIPLRADRPFTGGSTLLSGTLDLRAISQAIKRFETETGTHTGLYKLRLEPRVELNGSVAGRAIRDSFSPLLVLDVDELRLRVEPAATGTGTLNSLVRAKGGAGTRSEQLRLGAFGRRSTVAHARHWALLGAASGLGVLLLGALLLLLGRRGDEVASIRRRYADWIVDVAPGERPAGAERRVATMDALARIAERYDRLILHERRDDGDTFVIEDDGVVYRYDVAPEPLPRVDLPPDDDVPGWTEPIRLVAEDKR